MSPSCTSLIAGRGGIDEDTRDVRHSDVNHDHAHRWRKDSHPRQAIPQPRTNTARPTRAEGANPRTLGTVPSALDAPQTPNPRPRSKSTHPRRGLPRSGRRRTHPTHTQGAESHILDADWLARRGSQRALTLTANGMLPASSRGMMARLDDTEKRACAFRGHARC